MNERPERKSPAAPSLIDELLGRTRHFLAGVIADYLKRTAGESLRWILSRVMRQAISAALFIMAAVFLLLGGAEGLTVSGVPRYLAHLAMGAASLLAGLVALKCCAQDSGRE
jgi:hypothetical protein